MIHYFSEDIDFTMPSPQAASRWLKSVATEEGYKVRQLNVIFCSDAFLHQLNTTYLQHDTLTDVITFDYSETPHVIISDIYISVERVWENAATFKVSFEHELYRVLVHGMLHLMGFKDATLEEEAEMRARENKCLALIFRDNHK